MAVPPNAVVYMRLLTQTLPSCLYVLALHIAIYMLMAPLFLVKYTQLCLSPLFVLTLQPFPLPIFTPVKGL